MREIRTYGSEGGEAPQGAFPTLIKDLAEQELSGPRFLFNQSNVGK